MCQLIPLLAQPLGIALAAEPGHIIWCLFRFCLQLMREFYNETYYDRTADYLSDFSLTLLWSVSVSMFPFGGLIGSLMVGILVNKLGR